MKWLTFFENLALLGIENYVAVVHNPSGNTLTTLVSTDASVIGSLIQGLLHPAQTAAPAAVAVAIAPANPPA